jgi:hypothetical protein
MPAITKPNQYFDATLWTGDSTNPRSITNGEAGQSFQPDLVWVKARNSGQFHVLNDSVRGAGTALGLSSQSTSAEGNADIGLYGATTAFNSNGFSVGGGTSNQAFVNLSTVTYVAWQWKAGGAAVTNTAGSITSQVSANPTAGFSVVTYTGTGSSGSVGHGLGAVPTVILIKARSSATAWRMYQANLGITKYLVLNTTAAEATASMWGSPTDTAFVIGGTTYEVNETGVTYVAYCWAPIAGYSAFGSYVGNGSADGPFVYTGFRPRYFILKNKTNTQSWSVQDTARSPSNVASAVLIPNASSAEATGTDLIDIVSNGFKIRHSSSGNNNNSGDTYVYMAFAEAPFKYANAR